ncbi:hypothetical protein TruAng_004537 [Truncatella angustata]|nr:hypothetical protein TruAng_004537 [Truncatella angustata]
MQKSTAIFGHPQIPAPGFDRVFWVSQDAEILANWKQPWSERSLEDLYQDHPEKRLRSIEPSTLGLVAKTALQIADEAANNWLTSFCPGTKWSDSIINVDNIYDFTASEPDYTILAKAVSLQGVKEAIASLLLSSKTMVRDAKSMTPLILARVMDQSVAVCQVAKDDKRRVLLETTKAKVEWLPVALDCKRLGIQRRAIKSLEEHQARVWNEPAHANPSKQAGRRVKGETMVLDRALAEFQEYRLDFLVEMYRTLRQLLEATA